MAPLARVAGTFGFCWNNGIGGWHLLARWNRVAFWRVLAFWRGGNLGLCNAQLFRLLLTQLEERFVECPVWASWGIG